MAKHYGPNRTVSGLNVGSEDARAWRGYRLRMGRQLGSQFVYGFWVGIWLPVFLLLYSGVNWAAKIVAAAIWLAALLFGIWLESEERGAVAEMERIDRIESARRAEAAQKEQQQIMAERKAQIAQAVKDGIRKHEMEMARAKGNYIHMD